MAKDKDAKKGAGISSPANWMLDHHTQLIALLFVELLIFLPIYTAQALSITSVQLKDFTDTSTSVEWTTDKGSNSTVKWGENLTMTQNKTLSEVVIRHRLAMDTTPNKTYTYVVESCANDCAASTPAGFIAGLDTTPVTMNVTVPDVVRSNRVNLAVKTKPYSTVKLFIEGTLARMANPQDLARGETVFQNLILPKTDNSIKIESTDPSGNKAELTIKVTVDPNPPILEIRDFPEILQTPGFNLNGRVSKRSQVQVFVLPQNDVVPPERVSGLRLVRIAPDSVTIGWNPVQDKDISEYGIYRDSKLMGTTKSTEFSDQGIASTRSYTYRVQTVDANCNKGDLSDSISVAIPEGSSTIQAQQIQNYACEAPTFNFTTEDEFSQPIQLTSGTTQIRVIAIDRAGNTATYVNSTIFDNVPPQFTETNLDALSPSYTQNIVVRGKVSEKATVLVFINNEQSPSAFSTTEEDGGFAINAKLKRDKRVGDTGAGTTAGIKTGPTYGDLQGEGYLNSIKLMAVDIAKNTVEAGPVDVVLAQCGFGTGFSVDIGKPKPDVLNPRLILKNFGTIGFNVELRYLDSNETLDYLDQPTILVRPVSLEEQPKWDLDLTRSIRCSQDNTKCYVQLTVRPPAGIDNMNTTWEKEQYISDHRKDECLIPGMGCFKIPLELEIRYQKKQPTGDLETQAATFGTLGPRIESLTQRVCMPISVGIDKRIDTKLLPSSLLKSSVELFDSAIEAIDSILEPLQTVFDVVFYACYLGFTVGFFLDFTQKKSCEGAVLVGSLEGGGFDPAIAENGMCSIYFQEDKPELELKRQNCLRCQKSINDKKSTLQTMHQTCDRIFCPSAPSLQKYILDSQKKGVKHATAPSGAGGSKEFFTGSDCAASTLRPNLYQGAEGKSEIGIDEIFQLYKLHKSDKPEGDRGITIDALKAPMPGFTYTGRAAGGKIEKSEGLAPGSAPASEVKGQSRVNCANQHPSTTECCGYEYQTTWGPVCSLMMPDYEITESRCLSAQQTGVGAVKDCQGFRKTLNAMGGFCSRSMDVPFDLVPTTISYGKLKDSDGKDPLQDINQAKSEERKRLEKASGYENIQESRVIYINDEERQKAKEAENSAIEGIYSGRTIGTDITRGMLPDYIKDRRVYLKILPQEGGAFKVQRGYVVEKAVLTDLPALNPTKEQDTTLTETLEFISDLELTQFFQTPADGSPLVYSNIETAWISALCSREAIVKPGATLLPEGTVPRVGAGKSAMSGCNPKTARDAWDAVRRKVGVGDKDYIVNPAEDLSSSLKCGCLPGITTHLKKWKAIMTAVRNCFKAVLVTGDGTPGMCEAVLSKYVCDFLYTLIKCFVQRYSAGYQRPETEGGTGLLGIGAIGSSLVKGGTSITQDLQSRYGNSPTYKAAFSEQKMVNSICLFAFTGTFDLRPEALAETGIGDIPVDSQGLMFPCEKRFIQFDVSSQPTGLATWNYHIGAELVAGAELTYTLKLKCATGFGCDPTEGFQNGQCDCSKTGEKTQVVLSGNLKQYDNIGESGEVFENVQQKWRYDTAILEWQYRDKDGKAKTGTQACKIETIGGEPPMFCAFDILSDSFRCSTDIFSDFYAKFSTDPVPNYPDPLAQVFKLDDEVSFSVPIIQRIPEGSACTAGASCSSTKYLIYTIRNGQGVVIATNNQAVFDPSKEGQQVATDLTGFEDVDIDHILNTQGEKTYIVRLSSPLKSDHFNLASRTVAGGYIKADVTPTDVESIVTVQKEANVNTPAFDIIFDIKQNREWEVFMASGRAKTGNKLGGDKILQNGVIRGQGYVITITNPDKIPKDFTVFIPVYQGATTLQQKRCDPKKPSETTETWTAVFEIKDAEQKQLGSSTPGTQTSIVNGRQQTKIVPFKVICNTGLPLGKQKGECTEGVRTTVNCHCYPTSEQVADRIATGSKGNCGLSPTIPEACLDGNCISAAENICPISELIGADKNGCLCGYIGGDIGSPRRCKPGETCNMKLHETNECGIGTVQAVGEEGSIKMEDSPTVSRDQILRVISSVRTTATNNNQLTAAFLAYGTVSHVDPAFLVALANRESSIGTGTNTAANNCNNLFGIQALDGNSNLIPGMTQCPGSKVAKFNSQEESIAYAANLFATQYIPKGQTTLIKIGGPIDKCSTPEGQTYACCKISHCYCCSPDSSGGYEGWKSSIESTRQRIRSA